MEKSEKARLEAAISSRVAELRDEITARDEARKAVELDQQRVGRLSRMDALQQQAMANAQHERQERELQALLETTKRLDAPEFGACADCGDELAIDRLLQNPLLVRCMECIRG